MPKSLIQDRAVGAIMGAFIGAALGVGPHWYYNLDELHRDHGAWIDGYTEPKPGRYHYGLANTRSTFSSWLYPDLNDSISPR